MDNPIKYSDLISPDSSITDLITQLQKLQEQYANNLNQIKQGAQDLANSLKNVNGATQQGRDTIKNSSKDTEELTRKWSELSKAEQDNLVVLERNKQARREANQMAKLESKLIDSEVGSYNRLSAEYSLLKIKLNALSESERQNTQEGRNMEMQAKRIYDQMKKLQEATGKHQLNVGNYYEGMSRAMQDYGMQITNMVGGNNQLIKSFIGLGSTMNGTTTIMGGLKAGLSSLWSTIAGLATNPIFLAIAGVASVGAGFKWWYDYNSGIQEATRLTMNFTGLTGDALKDLRSEILAITDTWGHEYKDVLETADTLAANFKISFQDALKVIKDGFVAGADVNGDFLNKLKQYPAYFKEAGLSADKFVAIVAQTQNGIFGDKGLDAIKQANARIREMSKETSEAIASLGIDIDDITQKLRDGSMTTFDVLQMVSEKLSELPPTSQEVGNVLVDVFGKQGRDAGLAMIESLADISTNLDEVKAKTGELGELQEKQQQAEKELQVTLAALFDQTGGNFEKMKANVSIFIKQGLTNLIKGIIKLINWFIDLYNRSVAFRVIVGTIGGIFKMQFKIIGAILQAFVDVIVGVGKALKGAFTLDVDYLMAGVKQFSGAIPKMLATGMQASAEVVKGGVEAINDHMEPIKIPTEVVDSGTGETIAMSNIGGGGSASSKPSSSSSSSSGSRSRSSSSSRSSSRGRSASTSRQTRSGGGRTTDPIRALENQFKEEWRLRQENLKQRRAYEDSQIVLIENEEEREKKVAEYKYNRQIEDLQNTMEYWRRLHQINAKNQWTPEQEQWINERITALQLERTESLLNIERKYIIKRNEIQKEGNEMLLKTMKEGSAEELELRKKNLELERQTALMQDAMKPIAEQIGSKKINAMYDAELNNLLDEYTQHQLELFDKEQEYYQSEYDLLAKSEKSKTKYRLQAEKERLQKVLELNEKMNNKMSDVEVQTIKNQIAKIDQEIKSTPNSDIYDVFGLELGDEQKQAINESLQYATEALNSFMQSYVQAAEAKAQLAQKAVDDSKRVLEAEIEARNQGYASDVVTAQKELDLARKNQEKAKKQAEKAQRTQLALDTAQQASSMITASANIWSAFTKLGPWGVAAAVAATALMWGSFAASKLKALQMASSNSETYGEGTVELLSGGSHQSGNDVDLGRKADGTRRRAEGGEFFAVINKRNSRKYRKVIPDVIKSLNNGTFTGKYLNTYKTDDGLLVNVSQSPEELKTLTTDVSAIRRAQERRMYVDGRGNTIEVYRNIRRTTRR